MDPVQEDSKSRNFVLTAQALHAALPKMAMATRAIHADDFASPHRAIAPPIQVTLIGGKPQHNAPFDSHIYSRYTAPNSTRFETVLHNLFGGAGCVTYASGLASFHAIMVLLTPKRIFLGEGYHGIHRSINLQHRVTGVEQLILDYLGQLGPGDLLHIETPQNPTGEARNLEYYVAIARKAGAYFGVDIVMHSGTKYIGGHSDMLCGVLVVSKYRQEWMETLYQDRRVMGSVMGSFEGWLGIRSLRTLHLRVIKQSQTAEKLVTWLHEELKSQESLVGKMVDRVQHASLQEADLNDGWLSRQMPGGFGPVFSIWMKREEHAQRLPSRLFIFQHATSLGGVESLMEWRAMSDKGRDPRLMPVSCGVEDVEDMKQDILQAFESLSRDFP
ncbi:hypothetical protein BFJ63_vAg14447 [Fusarium oxysporum f. sp. narcissi]|uniref:Cystathionine beta-lyase n=1 Tax=Fusarium oxysporum f. sp. narcissi TaxID=451672 RepID=A0A4Q2VF79_FUSOX|nr:hypothetical protein FOWG_15868 [Fusarium oxysporum f. sp. lycopersici MN25]RYC82667.1 hypothetical protein BFJ63_vAg14447 [Fusarium oxysporum f. sp. narcissi]